MFIREAGNAEARLTETICSSSHSQLALASRTRSYHNTSALRSQAAPGTTARLQNGHGGEKPALMTGKNTQYVDEQIPYDTVSLVNRETHKLDAPTSLKSLIEWARSLGEEDTTEASKGNKRHKRETFYLQLMGHDPPVVKLVSKTEAFKHKRQGEKQQRAAEKRNITKEIQLTWGVAEGDWKHKANKVRVELAKGNRVDIVFAAKSGKAKPPTPEEMRAVETKMAEELSDVGFRWKDTEFTKTIMVLHIRNVDALPQNKKASLSTKPAASTSPS